MNFQYSRLRFILEEWFFQVSLSLAMGVYAYWLASERTWKPNFGYMKGHFSDTYYTRQAMAMLRGQLNVSGTTYGSDGECWFRAGKCFGYFGIFPSIIRMPFFLAFRSTTVSLSPIMIGIAGALAVWAVLDILRRFLSSKPFKKVAELDRRLIMLVTAVLMGSASTFTFVAQAKIFRETASWVSALVLVTFALVMRWRATGSNKFLIMALISGTCATNTRPSAIPALGLLGVWVMYLESKKGRTISIDFLSLPGAFLVVPVTSALAVFYLKFHHFIPPWEMYANYRSDAIQRYLSLNEGQLQGLRFVPTNLAQFFRPDSVDYSLTNPWARVLVPWQRPPFLVPPITPGAMYFEEIPSITNTMPIQLLLTVLAAVFVIPRKAMVKVAFLSESRILLASGLAMSSLVVSTFAISGRYVADFLPVLGMGTIVGMVAASQWLHSRNLLRPALVVLLAGGAYFSLVQYSLNIQGWGFSG